MRLTRNIILDLIAVRIIGMIPVFNESDIIGDVVDHLVSEGIQLVILDNGSTDGSYQICSSFLGKGVLSITRLVTERFDFDLLISKMYEKTLQQQADWVLVNGADEFLESPYRGLTLKEAIESEDRKGYNMIQFNNFEFWPTEKDYTSSEPHVRKRMRYYTWNDDLQFRAWKRCPGVGVRGTSGHYPNFPENVKIRIPRIKYIMRHYRIRSYRHGLKKVFSERLPRYSLEERELGINIHYDNFKRDKKYFIVNSANLIRYNDDDEWITKKTYDWTWGAKGKHWANPPAQRLRVRIAYNLPFAVELWKILFLRRKPLPSESDQALISEG